MVGKTPQARIGSWGADVNNNAIPKDIIYYFKESAYSNVISPGNGGISLIIENGVDMQLDMWSKVDAALTVEGAIYSHLYFDVDEWKFFEVRDWCPAIYGSPCQKGGLQKVVWISMDKLMDWPEGWGPK